MRVLVLGGTTFIGRRVVERLHARGDEVLVVHRGGSEPQAWVPVQHLHTDRQRLAEHADRVRGFDPEAVVDSIALDTADARTAIDVLPRVPTVVLSSMDVYEAFAALRSGAPALPVPLTEDSELRRERYPYRDVERVTVPADYEKLDVEEAWAARGACVLRLPMVYGPHDAQRREEMVLRRVRAGRTRLPVGAGTLLWSRAHVDDVATGVLAAVDSRAADGTTLNLAEPTVVPVDGWVRQVTAAVREQTGHELELVRVPDDVLPPDLALTGTFGQHLLASVRRAEDVLGWAPGDPAARVAESVRWHLANPPGTAWTDDDSTCDDRAIAAAAT